MSSRTTVTGEADPSSRSTWARASRIFTFPPLTVSVPTRRSANSRAVSSDEPWAVTVKADIRVPQPDPSSATLRPGCIVAVPEYVPGAMTSAFVADAICPKAYSSVLKGYWGAPLPSDGAPAEA